MFHRPTLDTIAEGSTLKDIKVNVRSRSKYPSINGILDVPVSSDARGRVYKSPMMDGRITGPKDNLNKALEVKKPRVQTIRHSVDRSYNEGDFRLGKKDKKVMRTGLPSVPYGCNGPVFCPVGKAMRNVITQHDPEAPILAATHEQFSHGGVRFQRPMADTSMMGAGGALPEDGPDSKSLRNAKGLHYTTDIPAATNMVNTAGHQSAVPFGGESGFL